MSTPAATPHEWPVRVYWEDTDASGIVYHASYLRFAERARTELLRAAGMGQSEMLARDGVAFAVRAMTVDFRRPARLDDALVVRTRVDALSGATIAMTQEVRRADTVLVVLGVTVVCIRNDFRPARIPPQIRESFAALTG